jgi:hypothetical protein
MQFALTVTVLFAFTFMERLGEYRLFFFVGREEPGLRSGETCKPLPQAMILLWFKKV